MARANGSTPFKTGVFKVICASGMIGSE